MERKVIQLLNHLDRNRFELHLMSLEGFYGNPLDYLNADIKLHSLQKRAGVHPVLALQMAKIFRRERIDIVHSHNWPTLFHSVVAAELARVPSKVHGEHGQESKEVHHTLKALWARKILYGRVGQVVAVAKDLKALLTREFGVSPEKIKVIENGVDIGKFANLPSVEEIRKNFNLPSDGPLIGSIAHLRPVKDVPTLIRAFVRVLKKHPNASLVVAGAPEEPGDPVHAQVERLIQEADAGSRIFFIGQTENVPALLSALSIYVNSSLTEGMSNTILEAMAAGLPVIASDVGGNPELVVPDQTGYLFPAQNDQTLAARILELLENPEQGHTMGKKGRARVEERHGFKRMLTENAAMYAELASAHTDG